MRNAGSNKITAAATKVRYAIAAAARSAGGIGVIDHPHPGQNAAFAGITVPQCGHFTEACAGFAGKFAGLFPELDNSASIRLLPIAAFFANAVDLESVAGGKVTVLASNLLLDFSNFLGEKFDRSTALGTHHVVMTAAVVLVFITRDAVVKGDFAGQTAIRQQFQRPIDGGEADARIGFLDQPMQFVGRKMFASFQEGPQNCVALFGLLQADALEMLQENSLGFADVLPRDGRLIVDSFLQHVGRRGNLR